MNKVLLIGCGHMGSALMQAWLQQKNIYFNVVDPLNYKKINKKKYNKVKAYKSLLDIKDISSIDTVIFAIKPQIISTIDKLCKNYVKIIKYQNEKLNCALNDLRSNLLLSSL